MPVCVTYADDLGLDRRKLGEFRGLVARSEG